MRILIVKVSSLGDVIQTIPVLRDIRIARPEAVVDWVVEEAIAPLLGSAVGGVGHIIPIAQRRWRKSYFSKKTRSEIALFYETFRCRTYDFVIDFQGLVKSAVIARLAQRSPNGEIVTYANASEQCSYEWPVRYMATRTVAVPWRLHITERYRLLAAGALRYSLSGPPIYDLKIPVGGQGNEVMFVHGTTRPDNEWPQSFWTELGLRLAAQGLRICIPHSNRSELDLALRLVDAIGPAARLLPKMSLGEIPICMAVCGAVIGVDSGLSHLAVALDMPHIQIFSQPRIFRAGPVGRPHQVAVGGDRPPTVDEVWCAWLQVMAVRPLNFS